MKVIIINGAGGSGKDTFVQMVKSYARGKYEVHNLSTITEVKKIAAQMGWNYDKDEAGRALLADLKRIWKNYNNGPVKDIMSTIASLDLFEQICDRECLVFIHCREGNEINEFKEIFTLRHSVIKTLLIKREGIQKFYNSADLNTDTYEYDYIIKNNGTEEELNIEAKKFFEEIENWN